MRLLMDMRYIRGKHKGHRIAPSITASAMEVITQIVMKSEGKEKDLVESIRTISLQFAGDECNTRMSADIVVLILTEGDIQSSRIILCSTNFESGKSSPVEAFAEQILDDVALATGFRREARQTAAA